MAEFKKISEVDVVTELTENDNILVVGSDGALKQTPSGNIKGGSGGAAGYVLKLTENNYAYVNYEHQCSDNYDEIYDILVSGGIVWVDYEFVNGYPGAELVCSYELSPYGLGLYSWDNTLQLPNGSHNLPEAPEE